MGTAMKLTIAAILTATVAYVLLASRQASAANTDALDDAIQGIWYTQDRDGGVELYPCDGKICGRLYWLKDDTGSRDDHNPDPAKRRRALCHLQFMGDFTKNGDGRYTDGWIYDPDSGSTYTAQMKIIDRNTLQLRGYILLPLFGASQIWKRAGSLPSCNVN
jgi:uncharacterized protein (DUF2147 family)